MENERQLSVGSDIGSVVLLEITGPASPKEVEKEEENAATGYRQKEAIACAVTIDH